MNGKKSIVTAALALGILSGTIVRAQEPPKMPYVFGMYCFMCHKEGVQIGPMGMFDMLSKSGNPLHEQFIRNNVRFGIKAMPAFRLSEVSPKELDGIVRYLKDLAAYRKTHPNYKPAPAQEGGAK
ncbi:cytochrome c [Geotalea sp. SG265]|uniref:c-type cytochrome n=1 Tax=Geotalea sp. SG265 TaxID=2922867 RepID=UPI001FAEB1DC|nr:cytochrome c [Geotalea sp. SG265]